MSYVKLALADGSWDQLQRQWREQCEKYDEDIDAYAIGAFTVLNELIAKPEPRAGVFATTKECAFDSIFQANVTPLPGHPEPVLRIRMLVLSPNFDFGDVSIADYVDVLTRAFFAIYDLSNSGMPALEIKFHLRSPADQRFFSEVSTWLNDAPEFESVQARGSWLYVTKRRDGR